MDKAYLGIGNSLLFCPVGRSSIDSFLLRTLLNLFPTVQLYRYSCSHSDTLAIYSSTVVPISRVPIIIYSPMDEWGIT